jgi:hypothetical protein
MSGKLEVSVSKGIKVQALYLHSAVWLRLFLRQRQLLDKSKTFTKKHRSVTVVDF